MHVLHSVPLLLACTSNPDSIRGCIRIQLVHSMSAPPAQGSLILLCPKVFVRAYGALHTRLRNAEQKRSMQVPRGE